MTAAAPEIAAALANSLLDLVLRAQTYTAPTSLKATLYSGNPLSGGTERTSGQRQAITFAAAGSKQAISTVAVNFTALPASTIDYIAILDQSNVILFASTLATSTVVGAGDNYTLASGAIIVGFDV